MSELAPRTLSVVVVMVGDTIDARCSAAPLAGCLKALAEQAGATPTEVIVPHHGRVDGLEEVRRAFPDVRFLEIGNLRSYSDRGGSREHHDELRRHGLAAARGDIIGLLEDCARPDRDWCARMIAAHADPSAAIGGAIENGIPRRLNWAVYFCDFGRYQNPLEAGDSTSASDANVTYKRAALEAVREEWRETYNETRVNAALTRRGERLRLEPGAIIYQAREGLRLRNALRERFVWGRSYAATRGQLLGRRRRFLLAGLSPVLPAILTMRSARLVATRRRNRLQFAAALPLVLLLSTAWSAGEWWGYITGRAASS